MPFLITLKLAALTTLIVFVLSIPLAYLIVFKKWKGKAIVESILMMPIILPPTVLGFYFLIIFSKNSTIGKFLNDTFNLELAFTFQGILFGSVIFCLPFMLTPIIAGFRNIPKNIVESTIMLKKKGLNVLKNVFIPYAKRSILAGILLTVAHTIGEFGVVLMIGGKMEGTRVASVAIFDEMNRGNYDAAHAYALTLFGGDDLSGVGGGL